MASNQLSRAAARREIEQELELVKARLIQCGLWVDHGETERDNRIVQGDYRALSERVERLEKRLAELDRP